MTAEQIRNWYVTSPDVALNEPHRVAIDNTEMLREIAAQIADANEARKPRWVNLSADELPCLVDATQVVGLSSGTSDRRSCVFVHLRGVNDDLVVFHLDHDEVRGKLGIDEDWMRQPTPYRAPDSVNVSAAEWNAATTAIADARLLLETVPADAPHAEDLRKAIATFDDFQMPF